MNSSDQMISLTIDDREVQVPAGSTIWDAAAELGIDIPVLCHRPSQKPAGVCRVCAVDVEGFRVLPASCCIPASNGMKVQTATPRVVAARNTLVDLLLSEHPQPCDRHKEYQDCELELMAADMGLTQNFTPRAFSKGHDTSNASIFIDHSSCILCDRCVRACSDIDNNVITRMAKGYSAAITFDLDQQMQESSCVNCGECLIACPTGAITAGTDVGIQLEHGDAISAAELKEIPIFAGVSSSFLERAAGGVVKRTFTTGDIICREEEYGSTAFYVLNGEVEIFLQNKIGQVDKSRDEGGFFKKMTAYLAPRKASPDDSGAGRQFIPIDAPVDLAYDNPVATLAAGDLFGEMTCLNRSPRSATVRATGETVVLELLQNVLRILQKNPAFQAQTEEAYRRRSLQNHMKSVDLFSDLSPEFLERLQQSARLLRFDPGHIICREGDVSDCFYLVRIGHVKVTKEPRGKR